MLLAPGKRPWLNTSIGSNGSLVSYTDPDGVDVLAGAATAASCSPAAADLSKYYRDDQPTEPWLRGDDGMLSSSSSSSSSSRLSLTSGSASSSSSTMMRADGLGGGAANPAVEEDELGGKSIRELEDR